MQGARDYARLFRTGQHGKLYIVSGEHARGLTFRVFVLPAGVAAIPNGCSNAPRNLDAVEVYGITGGNPGWTETYGWLHFGPWQDDFAALVEQRKREMADAEAALTEQRRKRAEEDRERTAQLLAAY